MRGALLMSVLALCAALSVHYARVAKQSTALENNRSDPLLPMHASYQTNFAEFDEDEEVKRIPAHGPTASALELEE